MLTDAQKQQFDRDGFLVLENVLSGDLLHTPAPWKRQRLGLGLRPGVASYHGDDEGYNRRGEAGIDFPANL